MNPTKDVTVLSELISSRDIDRYRISSDASHFEFIPTEVATPKNADHIASLFEYATRKGTGITFRSGGTSLSGQAVGGAILIDTRRHFRGIEILGGGEQVRVQPGATVRAVNARLARFGKKLGPDPASEIACTVGGVIANNSSGMACGITHNTYRTLQSATVVLFNGAIINTADEDSESQLQALAPDLYRELAKIKDEILSRPDLIAQISGHFKIKNTMGYGINSFIDFESIIDIFLHLLIGSEGTLGFIAQAVFNTIPLLTKAATTLVIFENLIAATQALTALERTYPATIELMDAASLRAGKVGLGELQLKDHAALLVEYQTNSDAELAKAINSAKETISHIGAVNDPQVTTDEVIRSHLWHSRKGLYAAVAGARKSGTTALLEDIAVPVSELANTCLSLQTLFTKYGYEDAVIFGHAKDGNIHFLLSEDFQDPQKIDCYREFTEEMVDLVLAKGGSLKAEHGTGRMMAPFVERQYGSELFSFMLRIKRAFDPAGVLNPGVLISSDPLAHIHNIKFNSPITASADNCVECGYCEPICPSKDLTTTPRQRIVIQRALAKATRAGNKELVKSLKNQSQYEVEESCAVDGLCQTSCPVGINTGELVKELRAERSMGSLGRLWDLASDHWGGSTRIISSLLSVTPRVPASVIEPINRLARAILGTENVPLWSPELPKGGKVRTPWTTSDPDFVLFSSCLETLFASQTLTSLKSLAKKAGLDFTVPDGIADLCCGTPWSSKGQMSGYETIVDQTYTALLTASNDGAIPIVTENSSCSEGLLQAIKAKGGGRLTIIDSVTFAVEYLLPQLQIPKKLEKVVLHPTCSSTLLGANENFQELASALSLQVTTPLDWGCCAFAGDRGLLHPELTASATQAEARSLESEKFDAYLSTNLTCEIGMSRATGKKFEHILCTLDLLAQSKRSHHE